MEQLDDIIIANGQVSGFNGLELSGKSTLRMIELSDIQRSGGVVAIIDVEHVDSSRLDAAVIDSLACER